MDVSLREAPEWIGADEALTKRDALMVAIIFAHSQVSSATPENPQLYFSADPDVRWVKNGSNRKPGYKAFADAEEGRF